MGEELRVLLVEDNPGDTRLIAEMLRESGEQFVVENVETLAAAKTRLHGNSIDVVLCDLGLPDSQGADTFERLQAEAPRASIIVLTGNSDPRAAERMVYEGAQDFLVKGRFDTDVLVRSITYAVGRRRVRQALQESEERYRELYEQSPLGYQSLDHDGCFITVNKAWLETLGYSENEVLGKWFGDFLAPEYVEAFRKRFPLFVEAGKIHSEFEMVHKSGQRRFVGFDGRIGYGDDGQFKQTHCILQDITDRRAAELAAADATRQLRSMVYGVAEAMGQAVEARDPYTQGHQVRVAEVSRALAVHMGLSEDQIAAVEMAALVHDIGKLSVPAEILTKPGKLSKAEFNLILEHPQHSFDILKTIDFPWPVGQIVLQHHERLDGTGYPQGLSGDEILLEARIIAVADVVEAMASHRPYRPALGLDAAVQEILDHPEKFDAGVSAACHELYERGQLVL
jgi:PAS domain S-box-containing protein